MIARDQAPAVVLAGHGRQELPLQLAVPAPPARRRSPATAGHRPPGIARVYLHVVDPAVADVLQQRVARRRGGSLGRGACLRHVSRSGHRAACHEASSSRRRSRRSGSCSGTPRRSTSSPPSPPATSIATWLSL